MNYYRCKCGNMQSVSSYSPSPCMVCPKCGTTEAAEPEGHKEPQPHHWEHNWTIDRATGVRTLKMVCRGCGALRDAIAEELEEAEHA